MRNQQTIHLMMRKKIVFSAALLAATCALNAQTTADNGYTAIPSPQNDQAIMFVLSPNGRYVGGYTYVDHQFYIYDAQQKTAKTFGDASADNLVDLRSISNDGKAVGMLSTGEVTDGVVCNFADGTSKTVKSTITKGLTPDGNFITGAKLDGSGTYWNAVYFDGDDIVSLPEPTTKWAGWPSTDPDDPNVIFGSSADFVSADTSVIAGYVIDPASTYPAVVWRKNRDGKTFSVDFISRHYFCSNPDSIKGEGNSYALFTPTALSENGKWLALTIAKYTDDGWGAVYGLGRYNLETDELEEYWYDESVGECTSAGIANDGTMTGWTGRMDQEVSAIWKAGAAAPQTLSEAFPGVPEFAEFDTVLGHKPCAISADGRYIVGYGYTIPDDGETGATEGYVSYIFDTTAKGATSGVAAAPAVDKKSAGKRAAARYDLSGRRLPGAARGINILKQQGEKPVKLLVK